MQTGVEPGAAPPHELRVHGEAGRQHVARRLRDVVEAFQGGPGPLRVHVVGRHGGHTPPVVDPGGEEHPEVLREVGRRLHMDVPGQQEAGGGDRAEVLLLRRGGCRRHRRGGLGDEVLDDDLLHMTVAPVGGGDRAKGFESLGRGLARTDEDPGGEGDAELAGGLEGGETALGGLVGRPPGGAAAAPETAGEGLDHHPLARAPGSQEGELAGCEGAGVGVREEPRLLDDEAAGGGEVLDRGVVTELRQSLCRGRIALRRALPQREEDLVTSRRRACAGEGEDVVRGEVGVRDVGGCRGERAVAATVPAEAREWHEHLGRVRDPPAEAPGADPGGSGHELGRGRLQEEPGVG